MVFGKFHNKSSGKKAISPVISSVIMTGAMVAIVSVALVFANNILWSRVAEGEFDSSKQFMQSVGLQIDDVAWTVGRTETIRYSSQYGEVVFEPDVLTYTISVETTGGEIEFSNNTGVLMFNLPTSRYSITNNYWERIFPAEDNHLPLSGTSAPVARVFVVEDLSMSDGSYIRVVVVPAIRVLYSSINSSTNTYYIRMYLPVLSAGEAPRLSQSITLTGESLEAQTQNAIESISITVDFPSEGSGFTSNFFNFPDGDVPDDDNSEALDIPPIGTPPAGYDDVVLELYLSEVSVDFGLNY